MAAPQKQGSWSAEPMEPTEKNTVNPNAPEPIARHLRRIASAAAWSVAPVVAGFLLFGYVKFALSVIGGAFVSFAVFSTLRILVYKALGALSPTPGSLPEPPGPMAQATFALGTVVKFIVAAGMVYGMWRLHVNLLALLVGFVIAQVSIALVIARSLKGPV